MLRLMCLLRSNIKLTHILFVLFIYLFVCVFKGSSLGQISGCLDIFCFSFLFCCMIGSGSLYLSELHCDSVMYQSQYVVYLFMLCINELKNVMGKG